MNEIRNLIQNYFVLSHILRRLLKPSVTYILTASSYCCHRVTCRLCRALQHHHHLGIYNRCSEYDVGRSVTSYCLTSLRNCQSLRWDWSPVLKVFWSVVEMRSDVVGWLLKRCFPCRSLRRIKFRRRTSWIRHTQVILVTFVCASLLKSIPFSCGTVHLLNSENWVPKKKKLFEENSSEMCFTWIHNT